MANMIMKAKTTRWAMMISGMALALLVARGISSRGKAEAPGQFPAAAKTLRKPAQQTGSASDCVSGILGIHPKVENGRMEFNETARQSLQNAFALCLSAYLQADTSNPGRLEGAASQFLGEVLKGLDIPYEELTVDGRSNLVASIYPPGAETRCATEACPSVVLYHHMDVVPVFPSQWVRPEWAFSGKIAPHPDRPEGETYIWGRGALDMKSIGILQLIAGSILKRSGIPFVNPVYWVAGVDEEVGASGAKSILSEMRQGGRLERLSGATTLLNEGGYGVSKKERDIYLIGAEEKGGAWMKLSHPSPKALLEALEANLFLFEDSPADSIPSLRKDSVKHRRWGCELSRFETPGQQVNVTPSRAELNLECKPDAAGISGAAIRALFEKKTEEGEFPSFQIEVREARPGSYSVAITLPTTGHGSLGGRSALQIAARGLQRVGVLSGKLEHREPEFYGYIKTPAVGEFIDTLLPVYGVPSWVVHSLMWIPGVEQFLLRKIGALSYSERLFRTSCNWTGFRAGASGAEALLDCRLIHTGFYEPPASDHSAAFAEEIRRHFADSRLQVENFVGWNYTASPLDAAGVKAIREEIALVRPEALVTHFLTPAGTDSSRFRAPHLSGSTAKPIASYGFFPVILEGDLIKTLHGSDERFPLSQAVPAAMIYTGVVNRLASGR